MHLIWFLTIGTTLSLILGEFGQFPFGVTSVSFSLTDVLLFLTLLFLFIWKIGIEKKVSWPLSLKLLTVFWFVGFISLIFSGVLSGGLYLLRFIFYSLSFYLGYELTKNLITTKEINKVYIRAGFLLAVLGFVQLFFFPDLSPFTAFGFDPHKNRMFSTILDPNYLGIILNLPFLLSLYCFLKTKDNRWILLVLFFALAILLTFSRSAYLAVGIEIFLLGALKFRRLLLISFLIVLILFFSVPEFKNRVAGAFRIDKTSSERIESWQKGFYIFKQNPLIGVGFNNTRYALEKNNLLKSFSPDGGNAGAGIDSSLIFVMVTTGIVGLFIWLSFWISIIIKIIKSRSEFKLLAVVFIVGLFVNSQFINSLFFPPLMWIYFLFLGGLIGEGDK